MKIYHVVVHTKESIFLDSHDKTILTKILKQTIAEMRVAIYAYCFMKSTIHILINGSEGDISEFIKRVKLRYIVHRNKRYKETGKLFDEICKHVVENKIENIVEEIKYIHGQKPSREDETGKNNFYWNSWAEYKGEMEIINIIEILQMIHKVEYTAREKITGMIQEEESREQESFEKEEIAIIVDE